MFILYGFFSVFIAAVFVNYIPNILGKTDQKLILHLGGKCYHLHHWIITVFLLGFAFLIKNSNASLFYFIVGGLLGFMAEDFLFRNEFVINVKC